MFGIPEKAMIRQPLSKKRFYSKFRLRADDKNCFEDDVSRVTIVGYISPRTVPAFHEGEKVKGYYVLLLYLKNRNYRDRNIQMLFRCIHQNMVFVLEYGGEAQMIMNCNGLQKSGWMPIDELHIKLEGLDMDAAWTNLIAYIGGYNVHSEQTIEEQIIDKNEIDKINKEIKALLTKRNKTKQTQEKFALHKQIVALQAKLKEYEQ